LFKAGGTTNGRWETVVQDHARKAARQLVQRLKRQIHSTKENDLVTNFLPVLQRTTVGFIFRYITHVDLEVALSGSDEGTNEERPANGGDDDISTASTVSSHDSVDQNANKNSHDNHPLVQNQWPLFASYLDSILHIRMIILAKSRSLWFLLPQWCYNIWTSSMARDEEETLQPIRQFATLACEQAIPGSPLERLRTMPLYQSIQDGVDKSSQPSQNLLDEAITLLFAGQDTSAATLSWTLHLLSLAPDVQDRLALEVCRATTKSVDDVPSMNTSTTSGTKTLPYLDAVIKEAMRLYPVAPFVVRRLPTAMTAVGSEGDVTLPVNTVACVWIYSLHRHPSFWQRPDDFWPERWLVEDKDQRDVGMTNGAYMPFAAGPRNCVGQPLAQIVLRTLLKELVLHFDFVDPRLDGMDGGNTVTVEQAKSLRKDMQAGFTILPKGGVELRVRRRVVK
jgi:hypothetical protein